MNATAAFPFLLFACFSFASKYAASAPKARGTRGEHKRARSTNRKYTNMRNKGYQHKNNSSCYAGQSANTDDARERHPEQTETGISKRLAEKFNLSK